MTRDRKAEDERRRRWDRLRREVGDKYRDVALEPDRTFDFYTGRPLAERLGYPRSIIDVLPDRAVESFAGVMGRTI